MSAPPSQSSPGPPPQRPRTRTSCGAPPRTCRKRSSPRTSPPPHRRGRPLGPTGGRSRCPESSSCTPPGPKRLRRCGAAIQRPEGGRLGSPLLLRAGSCSRCRWGPLRWGRSPGAQLRRLDPHRIPPPRARRRSLCSPRRAGPLSSLPRLPGRGLRVQNTPRLPRPRDHTPPTLGQCLRGCGAGGGVPTAQRAPSPPARYSARSPTLRLRKPQRKQPQRRPPSSFRYDTAD
mmetsp:Transcript_5193/g.13148  ORF Transcript_5193/g.13148 Transcript_5193/m.13148 type:complete len:231 (-) Transcript_5193:204-896(-)